MREGKGEGGHHESRIQPTCPVPPLILDLHPPPRDVIASLPPLPLQWKPILSWNKPGRHGGGGGGGGVGLWEQGGGGDHHTQIHTTITSGLRQG